MKISFLSKAQNGSTLVSVVRGKDTKFVETKGGDVLRIGYGEKTLTRRKAIIFARKIVSTAKTHRLQNLAIVWSEIRAAVEKGVSDKELGELISCAFLMADFDFVIHKTAPKEGWPFMAEIGLLGASKEGLIGLKRGITIGQEVNATRALSNTPGGDMTPETLARAAMAAVNGTKASCCVLGVKEMEKLGMGGVLGVGKGSLSKPRFIILEYWGEGKTAKRKPLVLIGKGITFDTGGLNIKPGDSMYEMHMDMSAGAAVIHSVALIAKLSVKRNVIGLVPAAENMVSGESYRPGDVLKSMSGKTIEVLNTDAEGRVVLADAITYSRRYNPEAVIEASTLTGASLIALGMQASALMSRDENLAAKLQELGEQSGEYVWPFPLWEEYEPMVKGNFGDVSNIPASGNSRYAGVIGGGMFLQQFADGLAFAHIDMAPRMTSAPGEFLAKGAAGSPVRLFLAAAENL